MQKFTIINIQQIFGYVRLYTQTHPAQTTSREVMAFENWSKIERSVCLLGTQLQIRARHLEC